MFRHYEKLFDKLVKQLSRSKDATINFEIESAMRSLVDAWTSSMMTSDKRPTRRQTRKHCKAIEYVMRER